MAGLTDRQRELRRGRITGSRAAACLGLSRYQTPGDAFCSIVYDTESAGSDAMDAGELLEATVLQFGSNRLGCGYDRRNLFRVSDEFDFLAATLDATLPSRPDEIMQAKTSGVTHYLDRESLAEWGAEGTDEIPQEYVIQCQHELYVAGARINWVPVLIGGAGFRLYRVERNEQLIEVMLNGLVDFYRQHVEPRIMPTDGPPCLETLKALGRQPGKTVPLDYGLVAAWLEAKTARLAAKEIEDAAQRAMLAPLGDAEAGECPEGRLLYIEESAGKRLEMGKLKAEQPDVYAKYAVQTVRRVPRFKVNKP